MKSFLRFVWFSIAATAAMPARASDGYFSGTRGARASGRAGAFTARADDLSAVVANPAGISGLEERMVQVGNRFSYNAVAFRREPTLDWGRVRNGVPPYVEFAPVSNRTPWQLFDPFVGVASSLGLENWGFALAAYAPPGIARQEYPVDGGQRYMMVRREAVILNYTASAAFRYADRFGAGISLQWVHVPRLSYQLVIDANQFPGEVNPISSELDMLATVTGSDPFTFNAILGAWYRLAPFLEVGISGQVIPSQIETKSTLSVSPLSPGITEDVVLRRQGEPANDVTLTLPLPVTAQIGLRYVRLVGGKEVFDVELDLGYESWSRVKRFTVDGDGLQANLLAQRIDVGQIVVEKRWRDTFSARIGGDFVVLPRKLTLRGGLFYESAVASDPYAHIDFVSGQELGGAVGASVFLGGIELAFAYEYRRELDLRVREGDARVFQEAPGSPCQAPYTDADRCHPEYVGKPAPAVNAGLYRAYSHVASLDVLYRF